MNDEANGLPEFKDNGRNWEFESEEETIARQCKAILKDIYGQDVNIEVDGATFEEKLLASIEELNKELQEANSYLSDILQALGKIEELINLVGARR